MYTCCYFQVSKFNPLTFTSVIECEKPNNDLTRFRGCMWVLDIHLNLPLCGTYSLCVFVLCVWTCVCHPTKWPFLSFIQFYYWPFYSSIHPSNFNCLLFYHPSLLSIHSTVYHSWTNNQLKLSTILSFFIILSNFNCLPFYLVIFIHTCIQMSCSSIFIYPSIQL